MFMTDEWSNSLLCLAYCYGSCGGLFVGLISKQIHFAAACQVLHHIYTTRNEKTDSRSQNACPLLPCYLGLLSKNNYQQLVKKTILYHKHIKETQRRKISAFTGSAGAIQISVLIFFYLLVPKTSPQILHWELLKWITLEQSKKDLTLSISQRHFHISKQVAKVAYL